MNWKLIFLLSFFGLAMGIASTYYIPTKVESLVWLPVFIFSAWVISKRSERRFFLSGFVLGIIDTAWNTAAHIYFYPVYAAHHAADIAQMARQAAPGTSAADTVKLLMVAVGIVIGIVSGIVVGSFSLVAAKVAKAG